MQKIQTTVFVYNVILFFSLIIFFSVLYKQQGMDKVEKKTETNPLRMDERQIFLSVFSIFFLFQVRSKADLMLYFTASFLSMTAFSLLKKRKQKTLYEAKLLLCGCNYLNAVGEAENPAAVFQAAFSPLSVQEKKQEYLLSESCYPFRGYLLYLVALHRQITRDKNLRPAGYMDFLQNRLIASYLNLLESSRRIDALMEWILISFALFCCYMLIADPNNANLPLLSRFS